MTENKPRWVLRLETFSKALSRLTKIIEEEKHRELNEFEKDSIIQRFEFTYEMAWKLLMSYEKSNGVREIRGSRDIVREALKLHIIENGEAWIEMIEDRNSTTHNYDEQLASDIYGNITDTYYPLLMELERTITALNY